ncbi:unnamed protein product [Protopolystoma xenopodis]|uniref:Uncharacterized protein n=1 Tax=Protopolystoma xenopodis TaxID=117903 RepID=A0A3S4ZRK5_9PLAT|nr:unnamed protein product [Protopolystoma xenopodis]
MFFAKVKCEFYLPNSTHELVPPPSAGRSGRTSNNWTSSTQPSNGELHKPISHQDRASPIISTSAADENIPETTTAIYNVATPVADDVATNLTCNTPSLLSQPPVSSTIFNLSSSPTPGCESRVNANLPATTDNSHWSSSRLDCDSCPNSQQMHYYCSLALPGAEQTFGPITVRVLSLEHQEGYIARRLLMKVSFLDIGCTNCFKDK